MSLRHTYSKSSEMREIEVHCTFRPPPSMECPFISERTMRVAKQNKLSEDRNYDVAASEMICLSKENKHIPTSQNLSKNEVVNLRGSSGIFLENTGFASALPSSAMGFDLYHYNGDEPPDFKLGGKNFRTISKRMMPLIATVLGYDEEMVKISPIAPPLPDWGKVHGKFNSNSTKSFVLKINRDKKDKEPIVAATGWQAIMAEMNRRKEGTLKKVVVEPVKVLTTLIHPKTKKKKGKVFKDIMEELSYKLAKLRGEVVESDEEDAETGERKLEIKSPIVSDLLINNHNVSNTVGARKLTSKPDLLSLLAKIKPPVTVHGNVEIIGAVASSQKIRTTFESSLSIPIPPMLPLVWPPTDHISTTNDTKETSSIVPVPFASKNNVTTSQVPPVTEYEMIFHPLSNGYYTPQPKFGDGLIPGGEALCVGIVDSAFCEAFCENVTENMFIEFDQRVNEKHSMLDDRCDLRDKLTSNDLPLPANFFLTVERLQKSNVVRSERIARAKMMELRNYNSKGKTRSKSKISENLDVSFPIDGLTEQKTYSFRKLDVQTNLQLSYQENRCGLTNWISSLRTTNLHCDSDTNQYKTKFQKNTVIITPTFHTENVVNRRQTKIDRQNHDVTVRNAKERKVLIDNKEFLKQRAISVAKSAGVYQPIHRLHHHDKLLSKYGNRADVSAALLMNSGRFSSFDSTQGVFSEVKKGGQPLNKKFDKFVEIDSYNDIQTSFIF
jgi:hypothetical protein